MAAEVCLSGIKSETRSSSANSRLLRKGGGEGFHRCSRLSSINTTSPNSLHHPCQFGSQMVVRGKLYSSNHNKRSNRYL